MNDLFALMNQEALTNFIVEYAYRPYWVYTFIVCFMTASSFGLPVPEEIVLLAAGIVGHMALSPHLYPPPFEGAVGVNVYVLTLVCFLSVWLSDLLIYFLGRFFGARLFKTAFFKRLISEEKLAQINHWFQDYSALACGVFRFTPGIRFPGHLTCGMLRVPIWKFALIDGTAAFLSVPTQVLAISFYGEEILLKIKEYKLVAIGFGAALISVYLIRKYRARKSKQQALGSHDPNAAKL